MKKTELFHTIVTVLMILSIGLTAGYAIGYYQSAQNNFPTIKTVSEVNPGVATVKLMEVKNGKLIGKISGRSARLVYNPEAILELKEDSEFTIPLNQINLKDFYVAEILPKDTLFIASKSGKYYYSVFDKRAFNITPANRLYFKDSASAEKQGYKQAILSP